MGWIKIERERGKAREREKLAGKGHIAWAKKKKKLWHALRKWMYSFISKDFGNLHFFYGSYTLSIHYRNHTHTFMCYREFEYTGRKFSIILNSTKLINKV